MAVSANDNMILTNAKWSNNNENNRNENVPAKASPNSQAYAMAARNAMCKQCGSKYQANVCGIWLKMASLLTAT